jgi:hypothetical protein
VVPFGANNSPAIGCVVQQLTTATEVIATFPYYQTFENGAGGWYVGGTRPSWEMGTPDKVIINKAYSGSLAWVTNTSSPYNINEASFVYSPIVDFTAISADPYISIRVWWDCEGGFDGALLQVLNTGVWKTVGNLTSGVASWYQNNNVDALGFVDTAAIGWSGRNYTGTQGSHGWVLASHILRGVAGTFSRFRIAFGADDSVVSDGFAFDDVAFQTTPSWIPPTSAPPRPTTGFNPNSATVVPTLPPPTSAVPVRTSFATQDGIAKPAGDGGAAQRNAILAGVLIPVGIILVVIVVALLVYFLVYRRKRQGKDYKLEAAAHELNEVEGRRG